VQPPASAKPCVMPSAGLRSPSPANRKVLPNCSLPGSLIRTAVAKPRMKPCRVVRLPSPALPWVISNLRLPGSPLHQRN
jgi:hypothetical protein